MKRLAWYAAIDETKRGWGRRLAFVRKENQVFIEREKMCFGFDSLDFASSHFGP